MPKASDMNRGLTWKVLDLILSYNRNTGIFTWKIDIGRGKCGFIAGKPHKNGYVLIGIKNKHYLAHRLAWFYIYHKWPKEIDHRNGIRNDNRINNIRECTRAQNCANSGSKKHDGIKGAYYDPRDGKFDSRIIINGQQLYLGRFYTAKAAGEAYARASLQYHGEFARTAQ